jgi:hypothetical protein
MVYFVGLVMDVKESGITVNVGEDRRCNVYIQVDSRTEWPARVLSGDRVRVAADATWKKRRDETFALTFTARKIEVK